MKNIKILFSVIIVGVVICLAQISAVALNSEISVVVNSKKLSLTQPPIMYDGRVMVPLRGVFEAIGATVFYENGDINCVTKYKTVQFTQNKAQREYYYPKYLIFIDGELMDTDTQPIIVDGKTMVPARMIAEALGSIVYWDKSSATVSINANIPIVDRLTKEDVEACNAFTIKAARNLAASNHIYRFFEHRYEIICGFPTYHMGVKSQNLAYSDENDEIKILKISSTGEISFDVVSYYTPDYSKYPQPSLTATAKYLPFQEKYDGYLGGVAYIEGITYDVNIFSREYFSAAPKELWDDTDIDVVNTPYGTEYFLLFPKYEGTNIIIRNVNMSKNYNVIYGDVIYNGKGPVLLCANLLDSKWPNTSVTFKLGEDSVRFSPIAKHLKIKNPYYDDDEEDDDDYYWYRPRFPYDRVMNITVPDYYYYY